MNQPDPFTAHISVDCVRVFCFVAGTWVIGLAARLAMIVRNTRQWGIWAMVFMTSSVVYTEFMRLGSHATPRIFMNVIGLILSSVYLYKMYGHREHDEIGDRDLDRLYPIPVEKRSWHKRWFSAFRQR